MIIYYTDGSTAPTNPGPGGFAVIKDMQPWLLGGEPGMTTNIRMEGMALVEALKDAYARFHEQGARSEVRTDSKFWIDAMTVWIHAWRKRKPAFSKVKNMDIVTELSFWWEKTAEFVDVVHVRGHRGEPGNELADEWANKAREGVRL